MLQERVKVSLKEECKLKENDHLVVGFSGGSDSLCLVDILSSLNRKITIVYFNHNLRDSVEEEIQFTRDIAQKYCCESVIGSEKIFYLAESNRKGIEETAREFRYRFLAKIAEDTGAAAVLTAHHADDQVETILMNLIRGTGLGGLVGMRAVSKNGFCGEIPICRPLLSIWKDEILSYCAEHNLDFLEDISNQDVKFTRNNLRQVIIPEIENINPKFKKGVIRMRELVSSDVNSLNDITAKLERKVFPDRKENYIKVDIEEMKTIHLGLQRRIILNGLKTNFSRYCDGTFLLVEEIRGVLVGKNENGFAKISKDIRVLREGAFGYIFSNEISIENGLSPQVTKENDHIVMKIPGKSEIGDGWCINSELIPQSTYKQDHIDNTDRNIAFLDAHLVDENTIVRTKEPGDRFSPLGMSGSTQKVSDFYINNKLPKRLRAKWPLVCSKEEIVWIPGYQIGQTGAVSESTGLILKMTLRKKS